MTGPSEVDPVVLAGEPNSVHVLEGGDDDLPPLGSGGSDRAEDAPPPAGSAPSDGPDDPPPVGLGRGDRTARAGQEWADADALLAGQPTELGELPPRP